MMMDFWEIYYAVVIAVFGLVFGSFLNCAAMRIARHEDFVHGRSHCMNCGHELSARDLVPVASWIFSRGRCRYCGAKVSVRYPLTELLFAALCAGVYLQYGLSAETVRDLVLTGCLFTLSIVDLECFEIPDGCLLISLAAWIAALPFSGFTTAGVAMHIAAGLLCGGGMLILSLAMDRLLKRESLGGGDIKLFALLGLYLGLWNSYFLVLCSSVLGLLFAGAVRLVCGRVTRGDEKRLPIDGEEAPAGAIPFGPAIALAGYGLLLGGDVLTDWYLHLFW